MSKEDVKSSRATGRKRKGIERHSLAVSDGLRKNTAGAEGAWQRRAGTQNVE